MSSPETTQSIELETPPISLENPSRSSSAENDTSTRPPSPGSFKRPVRSHIAPPTLVGISEEVVMLKFVKVTPTMKVIGKGKGPEITTLTQYEALPQLVDTSIPSKELETGIFDSKQVLFFELTS